MCVLSHSPFFVTPMDRLLCPWDFSDKNIGVGCHFPPPRGLPDPGIKLTSSVSPALRCILYLLSHRGDPRILEQVAISYSRGHLPNPGNAPVSLASPALVGGFFTPGDTWEALVFLKKRKKNMCVYARAHVTRLHANETEIQTVWKSTQ